MNKIYKIINFEVGDTLYKFKSGEWANHGKLVLEQGEMFGIRADKFEGVIMLRKDLLYREGFIASSYGLDKKPED